MNSAGLSNPPSFLQFCSAHCPSLNIMCNRPSLERQPLERLVRGRMVAKADLIGLLSWDALPIKHLFRISFSLGLPDVVDCGLSF